LTKITFEAKAIIYPNESNPTLVRPVEKLPPPFREQSMIENFQDDHPQPPKFYLLRNLSPFNKVVTSALFRFSLPYELSFLYGCPLP